jgi:hypothetical protein
MNTTAKTQQQAPKLPAHLQAALAKHEAKMKQFGLIDLSKLDRSKYDDNHPIHAMVR